MKKKINKFLHKHLCKLNLHKWCYKFEEVFPEEHTDFYGHKHVKGFPSISFYKNGFGEMIELPEGFSGYHREYKAGDPIFKKVRICDRCYKKQEYCRKYIGKKYWETINLSKDDFRDRTLKDILE